MNGCNDIFYIKLYIYEDKWASKKNHKGYMYQSIEVMISNYLNFLKQQNANIVTYVRILYSVNGC